MTTSSGSGFDSSPSLERRNPFETEESQYRDHQTSTDDISATTPSTLLSASQQELNHSFARVSYKSKTHRPLIDQVTNEWRKSPYYTRYQDDDYEEDEYGQLLLTKPSKSRNWSLSHLSASPKRTFRYLAIYVAFLLTCLYFWNRGMFGSTSAIMTEEEMLDASMYKANTPGKQFGTNARPDFADLKQIGYMESEFVPGASHASRMRLVAVGDVHGCKKELIELLEKISFDEKRDHLVLTGDMVYKGPDSGGVIDLARHLKASCVRGNHDDRTILAYNSIHQKSAPHAAVPGSDKDPQAAVIAASSQISNPSSPATELDQQQHQAALAHGYDKHLALAKQLTPSQIKWLQSCPCILNIGNLGPKQDYVVVHAGLAPGIRLEKQDPRHVMNMRTIDLSTRVPSAAHDGGESWSRVWNHYQRHLAAGMQRKTVIYGHDARTGFNIQRYSRGLDSGCVNGGKLTALIIDATGKEKFVSVQCRNYLQRDGLK